MIRHRPAKRRQLETIGIEHEGQQYKIGLGRSIQCDGSCGGQPRLGTIIEVFLNGKRANSQLDVLASDGAILMSMLIQYSCPPADIFHAMKRNSDGSPASPLGRAAAYLVEEQA